MLGPLYAILLSLLAVSCTHGLDYDSTRIKSDDEPHMVSHTILQGVIEPFESSVRAEVPAWKQMKDAADYKAAKLFLSQALVSYSQLLRHPYMFGDMPIEDRYDVFLSMAKILKRMGFQQRAELLLYEAMSYTTSPHEAHYQLALLALNKEELPEAKMHLKNCLFHKPDDVLILAHLSMVLIAESKQYEAKFYLSQLLSALEVRTKSWLRASGRDVKDIVDLTAPIDHGELARWLEEMMVRVIHGELQMTTSTTLQLLRMCSNLYTLIGDGGLTGRFVFDIGQSLYEGGRPRVGHMMMSRGHSTSNIASEGEVSYEVVKTRLHMDYPIVPSSVRDTVEHYFNITLFLSGAAPGVAPAEGVAESISSSNNQRVDIENMLDVYWPVPLLGWMGLPVVPLVRELLWRFDGVPVRRDIYGKHFLAMTSSTGNMMDVGSQSAASSGSDYEEEDEDDQSPYPSRRFPYAASMYQHHFDLSAMGRREVGTGGGAEEEEDEEDEDGDDEANSDEGDDETALLLERERQSLGSDYADSVKVIVGDEGGHGSEGRAALRTASRRLVKQNNRRDHHSSFSAADADHDNNRPVIEVGILSGHANAHPVGQSILTRVLGSLSSRSTFDTSRFRVTLLALMVNPDHVTKKIATGVHAVVNLPLDKKRAWAVLESLALDVLLVPDWAPFPDAQSLLLGSARIAPVQACFFVRGAAAGGCPLDSIDYYLLPEELQDTYLAQVPASAPSDTQRRPGWLEAYSQQVVLLDWPLLPSATIQELASLAAVSGSSSSFGGTTSNHHHNTTNMASEGTATPTPGVHNLGFVPLEVEGQVFFEDQPVAVLPLHPGQLHPLMDEVIFKIMQAAPHLHLILVLPRVYFTTGAAAGDNAANVGGSEDENKISWARILVRRLWRGGGGLYHRIRLLPTPLNDRRLTQLLRQADMLLDSFPVGNSMNFLALALSVGTPVVTLRPGTKLATGAMDLSEVKAMLRNTHTRAAGTPLAGAVASHPLYQRLLNSSAGQGAGALPWLASSSAVAGFYQRAGSSGDGLLEASLVADSLSSYYSLASRLAGDREHAYQLRVSILDAIDRDTSNQNRRGSGAHIEGLWSFLGEVGAPWASLREEYYQSSSGGNGDSHSGGGSVRRRQQQQQQQHSNNAGSGGSDGDHRDHKSGNGNGRRRKRRRGRSRGSGNSHNHHLHGDDFDDSYYPEGSGIILTE
jgi:hypothetical protein